MINILGENFWVILVLLKVLLFFFFDIYVGKDI